MNKQPLSQRTVTVLPYQDHWPQAFASEQGALLKALGSTAIALHHIGSTAVPGLAAKPILDLLLEVTDLVQLDACTDELACLGYVAKGENGIAGRRYYYKNSPEASHQRSHHLHAFVSGAPQIRQHLALRDYLRKHPVAVAKYAELKQALARQFPNDSQSYQAGKDHFIAQLLQQALKEQDHSNGYQAKAAEFRYWREQSSIGVATVLQWAQGLPAGTAVLDLGCGSGLPLGKALSDQGFSLFGIDAAPALATAYQQHLPQATVACEALQDSDFFQRRFVAVLCVGVLFLLPEAAQRQLFAKVAAALIPGGVWLFSAPAQACRWVDMLTGQESVSLGVAAYQELLQQAGLQLQTQYQDEGGNHYTAALRPVRDET